jgi:hypothetical protein
MIFWSVSERVSEGGRGREERDGRKCRTMSVGDHKM